jgi:hypothetical protein
MWALYVVVGYLLCVLALARVMSTASESDEPKEKPLRSERSGRPTYQRAEENGGRTGRALQHVRR